MRKLQDRHELDKLLEAGSVGHFPLFYQSWIHESFADAAEAKRMSFSRAAETVHKVFRQLERHHSLERMKVAIQALKNEDRKDFIISFMKMVEYRTLDKLKELH